MQLPDIWQLIGSPQIAEITALISIAIALVQKTPSPYKKSISTNNHLKKMPRVPLMNYQAKTVMDRSYCPKYIFFWHIMRFHLLAEDV